MRIIFIFLAIGLFHHTWDLLAQEIQQVRSTARKDLEDATARLAEIRKRIENEKIPIAQKVASQEREAKQKREELDRLLRLRDNRDANLLQLKEEVQENERELESSLRLLKDYARSWRQGTPRPNKCFGMIPCRNLSRSTPLHSMSPWRLISKFFNLVSRQANKTLGELHLREMQSFHQRGIREEGTFWSLGPVTLFSGVDGSAGFVEKAFQNESFSSTEISSESVKKSQPSRIVKMSENTSQMIQTAFSVEPDSISYIPLDPSLGKAFVMEVGELSLLEELQTGGIWIYPILFFAALSLVIAIYKAFQILDVPTYQGKAKLEGSFRGPFEILRKTAHSYQGNKPEILEEILYEQIIDFQVRLEKALPLIAVTAATAPLLGLLGTVTGMIDVFRQITNFANPENSELARGISEALVTTKFGLITAIPSLIAHALLSRRLQGVISKLEGFAARLVHLKRNDPLLKEPDPQKDEPPS